LGFDGNFLMARNKIERDTDSEEYGLEDTSRLTRRQRWAGHLLNPLFRLLAWVDRRVQRSRTILSFLWLIDWFGRRVDSCKAAIVRVWQIVAGATIRSSYADAARMKLDESTQKVSQTIEDVRLTVLEAGERSWAARVCSTLGHVARQAWFLVRHFTMEWVATRNYRRLVGGTPALLLTLPLAMCIVRMPFYGSYAKAQHYRKAMNDAILSKDFQAIDLIHRKLSEINVSENDMVMYQSAIAAYEAGNSDDAVQRMRQLAPLEEAGFLPAHLWIATYLSDHTPKGQDRSQIITHLRQALSLQPDRVDVAIWLADEYRIADRPAMALDLLDKYERAARDPSVRIHIADLYSRCGRNRLAFQIAQDVETSIRSQQADATRSGTQLRNVDFMAWAYAAQMRNDLRESLRIAELGRQDFPDDQRLADYTEMLRLMVSGLSNNSGARFPDLARIKELLKNQNLRDQLASYLAMLLNSSFNRDPIRQLLEEDIESNPVPVPDRVLQELAKSALNVGDATRARRHYEAMVRSNPNNAAAMNDLAWLLAHHKPVDLARAMTLVDKAIELDPGNVHYHDTRGHILAKLDRWEEAVVELERAVNGLPGNRNTHAVLAQSYERLGNAELAEAHRRLSRAE
jgi:predicted Zn-dependent protease